MKMLLLLLLGAFLIRWNMVFIWAIRSALFILFIQFVYMFDAIYFNQSHTNSSFLSFAISRSLEFSQLLPNLFTFFSQSTYFIPKCLICIPCYICMSLKYALFNFNENLKWFYRINVKSCWYSVDTRRVYGIKHIVIYKIIVVRRNLIYFKHQFTRKTFIF